MPRKVANLCWMGIYIAPMFLLFIEEAGVPLPVPGDVTLAYLLYRITKNKSVSTLSFTCAILIILTIGVSRIYLGVHFPSDVLAGFLVGIFWFTIVLLLDKTITFLQLFNAYKKTV